MSSENLTCFYCSVVIFCYNLASTGDFYNSKHKKAQNSKVNCLMANLPESPCWNVLTLNSMLARWLLTMDGKAGELLAASLSSCFGSITTLSSV